MCIAFTRPIAPRSVCSRSVGRKGEEQNKGIAHSRLAKRSKSKRQMKLLLAGGPVWFSL